MRPWLFATLALSLALIHWILYVGLFGLGFALGVGGAPGLGPVW